MVLLKNFINIFFIPELRRRLFFTVIVALVLYRFGSHVPIVGIDIDALKQLMEQKTTLGGLFVYLDLLSGGNLRECTLFALGISPYITASIIMQILTLSMPSLERMVKEGEFGRKIINQYTRYLALGVSIIQSFGFSIIIEKYGLALEPGWTFRITFMLLLVVGSLFVMWLGEQISLFGIGNGSSIIIFSGIVARFPSDVIKTVSAIQQGYMDPIVGLIVLFVVIAIAACIVFLEKGERKIPVQYSKRVIGQRVYAGQSTYIPFKINTAGIMPVIFANAALNIPIVLCSFLATRFSLFKTISDSLAFGGMISNVLTFFMIIFFSFLYTALVYNPDELAENIKKGGGFILGIRPGRKTAEYFHFILTRIGLVGALYLAILTLLPNIFHALVGMPFALNNIMSGTALLIAVGVALEVAAQIESYLIEHRYEGFLSSGRLKGRRI